MHHLLKETGKYTISTFTKDGRRVKSGNLLLRRGFSGLGPHSFRKDHNVDLIHIVTPSGKNVKIHSNKIVTFT